MADACRPNLHAIQIQLSSYPVGISRFCISVAKIYLRVDLVLRIIRHRVFFHYNIIITFYKLVLKFIIIKVICY